MNTATKKIIKIKVKKTVQKVAPIIEQVKPLDSIIILFNAVLNELIHCDKVQMMLDLFNKRKMKLKHLIRLKTKKRDCYIEGRNMDTYTRWSSIWGVLESDWFIHVADSYNNQILYEIIKTKTLNRVVLYPPRRKCGVEVVGMVRILSKDGEKYCITGRTKPTRFNIACEQTNNHPSFNTVKSLQQACRDNRITGFIHWNKKQLVEHLMKV